MKKSDRSGIDYKAKYMDLRARFIEALDLSFRQGYEQGQKDAQIESSMQQAQMAMQQAQQMSGQQQDPNQEQPQDPAQAGAAPEMMAQQGQNSGTELDSLIGELEGLVNKSEISKEDLKKSISAIKESAMFMGLNKAISKNSPFKSRLKPVAIPMNKGMSGSYSHNLSSEDKKAVAMQQAIIDNVFKKWENESADTGTKITQTISTEALTKKE